VTALFPAIDLRGGRCVRLTQGDYDRETVYGDDPVRQARVFADAGARWVHVVDLDAARSGEPTNRPVIAAIAAALAVDGVAVQTGGGVRSVEAAAALFDAGVRRVVVGTAAIETPELVPAIAASGRVALGLDVHGRDVAVRGWERSSGRSILEVLAGFDPASLDAVVATQIAVDGTLAGPDLGLYRELLAATSVEVIASGGVGSAADLAALAALEVGGRRLAGAIVGKAIYDGACTVEDALAAVAGPGALDGGR